MHNRNDIVFIDTAVSLCIYYGISKELELPCPVSSVTHLFIPLCIGFHWILCIANLKKLKLSVHDSSPNGNRRKYKLKIGNIYLIKYLKKAILGKLNILLVYYRSIVVVVVFLYAFMHIR